MLVVQGLKWLTWLLHHLGTWVARLHLHLAATALLPQPHSWCLSCLAQGTTATLLTTLAWAVDPAPRLASLVGLWAAFLCSNSSSTLSLLSGLAATPLVRKPTLLQPLLRRSCLPLWRHWACQYRQRFLQTGVALQQPLQTPQLQARAGPSLRATVRLLLSGCWLLGRLA